MHANTADDALYRLETLATMSDLHIPTRRCAVHQQRDPRDLQIGGSTGPGSEVAVVASPGEPFELQTAMRLELDRRA